MFIPKDMMQRLTELQTSQEVVRKRYLVNAEGQILGRLAQEVAKTLRGKGKTFFSYHLDLGDHVIVFNAEKIRVTGRKLKQKTYTRYSGYPGGLKRVTLEKLVPLETGQRTVSHDGKSRTAGTTDSRKSIDSIFSYPGDGSAEGIGGTGPTFCRRGGHTGEWETFERLL